MLRQFLTHLHYKIFTQGGNLLAIHESDPTSSQIHN